MPKKEKIVLLVIAITILSSFFTIDEPLFFSFLGAALISSLALYPANPKITFWKIIGVFLVYTLIGSIISWSLVGTDYSESSFGLAIFNSVAIPTVISYITFSLSIALHKSKDQRVFLLQLGLPLLVICLLLLIFAHFTKQAELGIFPLNILEYLILKK